MQQAADATKQICKTLRNEIIDGDATTVYGIRDAQADGDSVDSTLWLSQSRGLPLRQSIDTDVGGRYGTSHSDVRYDYANVQPAGVKQP